METRKTTQLAKRATIYKNNTIKEEVQSKQGIQLYMEPMIMKDAVAERNPRR